MLFVFYKNPETYVTYTAFYDFILTKSGLKLLISLKLSARLKVNFTSDEVYV